MKNNMGHGHPIEDAKGFLIDHKWGKTGAQYKWHIQVGKKFVLTFLAYLDKSATNAARLELLVFRDTLYGEIDPEKDEVFLLAYKDQTHQLYATTIKKILEMEDDEAIELGFNYVVDSRGYTFVGEAL
jgi:hypothetical protein